MNLRDELLLTCTDKGQHASAQIARVLWSPDTPDGFGIWTPGDPALRPDTVAENARQTRAGRNKVTTRKPVERAQRADGGHTFNLRCPRCRRTTRLRDDTLDRLRQWPDVSCDISLMPM